MNEIKSGDKMFYIGESETEAVARIHYKVESDKVIIANSTFVDPSLRGQQIAKKLLDRLADYARENNLKIRPTCSYVVTAFERYKEYEDVKL
ncbi:GNAT family N-acetyltransferase [Liberiplasma polymorphum]|uniref:GNAT family N-acetyltransferase n=1 Tax=Liberiplasma polymorphum TaxID=3374570 RepID=UPI003775BB29